MTRYKEFINSKSENLLTLFLLIGIIFNCLFVFKSTVLYLVVYIILFLIFLRQLSMNIRATLLLFNSINLYTLLIRIDPFFTTAQNVYYPKILSNFNFGNVSNFWIVEIDDPYPAFSILNKFFISNFGLKSINILLFLISAIFIFVIYKFSGLVKSNNSDLIGFVVSLFLIFFIIIDNIPTSFLESENIFLKFPVHLLGFSNILLDGLASYSEFNSRRALIPASFDILIIVTIYLFIKKKYLAGIVFGFFISLFHYFSFINLALIIFSLIFTLYVDKNKKYIYSLTFLLLGSLIYLSAKVFSYLTISEDIIETLDILYLRGSPEWILKPVISFGSFTGSNIETRFFYSQFDLDKGGFVDQFENYNYINPTPGAFDDYSVFPVEFLIISILGFFISKKVKLNLISNVIFFGLSISTITWFLHAYQNLGPIVFFQPYRLSALTSLLSSIVIITFLVSNLNFKILRYFMIFGVTITLLSPLLNTFYNDKDPDSEFLNQNLKAYTQLNSGTIMIPPDKTSWILNSGGIDVYFSKLFPYELSSSEEWLYRYELQNKIYRSDSCEKLETHLKATNENIVLIISNLKDQVSTLENKCNVKIIVYYK